MHQPKHGAVALRQGQALSLGCTAGKTTLLLRTLELLQQAHPGLQLEGCPSHAARVVFVKFILGGVSIRKFFAISLIFCVFLQFPQSSHFFYIFHLIQKFLFHLNMIMDGHLFVCFFAVQRSFMVLWHVASNLILGLGVKKYFSYFLNLLFALSIFYWQSQFC